MSSIATDNSLLYNFKFMEKVYLYLKSQKKGRELTLLNNLRMSVLQYFLYFNYINVYDNINKIKKKYYIIYNDKETEKI